MECILLLLVMSMSIIPRNEQILLVRYHADQIHVFDTFKVSILMKILLWHRRGLDSFQIHRLLFFPNNLPFYVRNLRKVLSILLPKLMKEFGLLLRWDRITLDKITLRTKLLRFILSFLLQYLSCSGTRRPKKFTNINDERFLRRVIRRQACIEKWPTSNSKKSALILKFARDYYCAFQ